MHLIISRSRSRFIGGILNRPPRLAQPYVIVGAGVFAAETDAAAQRLASSGQLQFLNLIRGRPGRLPPPVESMDGRWSAAERAAVMQRMRCSAVGSPETVRQRLSELLEQTQADEIIATAQIYDHSARLRSFKIAAEVFQGLVRGKRVTTQTPTARR